jgi:acetylornithine aminotransferase
VPGVTFVAPNDIAALEAAVDANTAAIFLEPVMGEGGIIPLTDEYLFTARKLADQTGAVLVFDEIQCGLGRTGKFFAFQHSGVVPDIVTLAKPLGGGLPLGAVLTGDVIEGLVKPGHHGTTFGGNPVSTAAALAVIRTIESDGLLEHVKVVGETLRERLSTHPLVKEVTGRGLLVGIVLAEAVAAKVQLAALDAGLILNAPAPDRLRLAPPLILTSDEAGVAVTTLATILDEVTHV